jgi:flagellar assembly protein FliH
MNRATTDKGRLTAWERWELADFDDAPSDEPEVLQPAEPAAVDSPPEAPADSSPAEPPPPEPAVVLPTAEDVEQIYQQARDDGTKAGYKEGQAKARDEATRLGRAAAKLEAALNELDSGVADELLALSIELARLVVRSEISARPESLLAVIHEALGQLPHQHAAIYLHPDDASLARSYLGDQLAHAGHRIHEDSKLARGDCVLDAGGSHLDATLATRWRRVLESLGIEDAWPSEPPP